MQKKKVKMRENMSEIQRSEGKSTKGLPKEITEMMGSKALSRDSTKKTLRRIYYSLKIWGESLLYGLLQTPRALSFHCGICCIPS